MATPNIPFVPQRQPLRDLGKGITAFMGGIKAEQDARRQRALEEALLEVRKQAAMPEPQRPQLRTRPKVGTTNPDGTVTPGGMEYFWAYPPGTTPPPGTDVSAGPAPNQLFMSVGEQPSDDPNAPPGAQQLVGLTQTRNQQLGPDGKPLPPTATTVQMPPNTRPRDVRPSPIVVEGAGGPQVFSGDPRARTLTPMQTPGGGGAAPRADEGDERRARDAFEMIQANRELEQAAKANPNAYNEAAEYLAQRNFLDAVPVIGKALDQILSAAQNTLSPEGAMVVRAWTAAGSARAFARGGATLTANEIRWAIDAIGPRIQDPPQIKAQRLRMLNTVLFGMTTGNPAWQRYDAPARSMGYVPDYEALDPLQSLDTTKTNAKARAMQYLNRSPR